MRHSFAWFLGVLGLLVTAIAVIAARLRYESERGICIWCAAPPGKPHSPNCQRGATEL